MSAVPADSGDGICSIACCVHTTGHGIPISELSIEPSLQRTSWHSGMWDATVQGSLVPVQGRCPLLGLHSFPFFLQFCLHTGACSTFSGIREHVGCAWSTTVVSAQCVRTCGWAMGLSFPPFIFLGLQIHIYLFIFVYI